MEPPPPQERAPAASVPRIYSLSEIEKITNEDSFQTDLIQAIQDGFLEFHRGQFFMAPIQTLGAPPMAPFSVSTNADDADTDADTSDRYAAQTCVKSGYFQNNPYYVIKVASGGYPFENTGLMQLFSQKTGGLEALLLDQGMLTELRTAAVGALATKLLAPKKIQRIGVIGTGVQARYQLKLLAQVTDCRRVVIWGRSPDKVETLREELSSGCGSLAGGEWDVEVASHADDLLESCQVIVTVTSAREAVLGKTTRTRLKKKEPPRNLLIICIGSDAPGKMELDPKLVEQAALLVADNPKQSTERGEFQTWFQTKLSLSDRGSQDRTNNFGEIVSLGELIEDRVLRRRPNEGGDKNNNCSDDRFIIFDSSGVALQDCVVAQMVYEALFSKAP